MENKPFEYETLEKLEVSLEEFTRKKLKIAKNEGVNISELTHELAQILDSHKELLIEEYLKRNGKEK